MPKTVDDLIAEEDAAAAQQATTTTPAPGALLSAATEVLAKAFRGEDVPPHVVQAALQIVSEARYR